MSQLEYAGCFECRSHGNKAQYQTQLLHRVKNVYLCDRHFQLYEQGLLVV